MRSYHMIDRIGVALCPLRRAAFWRRGACVNLAHMVRRRLVYALELVAGRCCNPADAASGFARFLGFSVSDRMAGPTSPLFRRAGHRRPEADAAGQPEQDLSGSDYGVTAAAARRGLVHRGQANSMSAGLCRRRRVASNVLSVAFRRLASAWNSAFKRRRLIQGRKPAHPRPRGLKGPLDCFVTVHASRGCGYRIAHGGFMPRPAAHVW